jgi:predicted ester cyclase
MHGFRTTIDEQFVSGDRVVTIFTHHGRHIGDFAGIPGTGREVTWTGIQIDRLRDGKVVEMWVQFDQHGLFEQIRAARDGVPA